MSTSLAFVAVVCEVVLGFAGLMHLNGTFHLGGLGAAGLAEDGEQDDASTGASQEVTRVCWRSRWNRNSRTFRPGSGCTAR